ncbi:conserved hypothetical protein DUF484 [Dinoroseobacter shibae DFL 12 = DSM 16493]|jgi:uncharacterized protein YigA (DUF484 family)|uniref:Uncharacterized protein n=1 Tax=Dinoroseobacter shibae (strain DSM 16493 / NCIMB 14021 / DFL 12) TaxID=398580 RepID=A8LNY8_DINSH|nr:DUF484 family protein [Dinoroseobacter shibae]ABV93670.1 conserved hypothetical protein DUF484 [Dinoroseobacter shibae DFL 12 = DSM 16493]URF45122.1 DUF484 family protein [Dinoroseobacter shibae]URF49427.1 DUF484 family protein [Dinoroseobacter shibae]
MTDPALKRHDLKERIMAEPDVILEDPDLMRALLSADAQRMGDNIVDLRGLAMDRLQARLGRLEDTHRSVIAAAYENLAGTNQVHRAVLSLLEPHDFAAFMHNLGGEVASLLQVDAIRLVLETDEATPDPALAALDEVLSIVPRGRIDTLIGTPNGLPARKVTLQAVQKHTAPIYGEAAPYIASEALLRLEFGEARLPGLMALGAEDASQFTPNQGTDLLSFFAKVVERAILRWIV